MLLGLRPDVEVVASVEDGNDVVTLCRTYEPDVVVMDYRLELDGVRPRPCSEGMSGRRGRLPDSVREPARDGGVARRRRRRVPDEGRERLDEIVDTIRAAAGDRR